MLGRSGRRRGAFGGFFYRRILESNRSLCHFTSETGRILFRRLRVAANAYSLIDKAMANIDRHVFIDRARMRLLLTYTESRE
jgi:hypothetical protein